MEENKAKELLAHIPLWDMKNKKLFRHFEFKDFVEAMKFLNKMAEVAEEEGHHPDFSVHYRKVDVEVWTHAVNGLTENDFILAAKIDRIRI